MYKVEIFSDQFVYKSMAMVDEYTTTIEQDFLTYDSNTIQTPLIDCEKGDLVHITDQDNNYVADGIIGDVQPSDKAQEITIRPLNALFDTEVFYTAVTDCITWLATNIDSAFMSNTDTLQNRPITLTYTASAEALPLTGFNLHETVNILSVMISAMKTYGVVVASRLDLPNKRFTVDIYQQTATKVLEASLDNVLQKSVTIGDNYGSTNKAVIRKIRVVDDVTTVLGQTEFYLHTDGTINATDGNRIVPVFWEIESLELDDDMTETEWQAKALSRAKEILTPAKYDNEIVLQYDRDDLLARPADILIGTATTIYLDGTAYASILTGKRIEGQKITLIFGVTRTELTKQLSIKQRESVTYQNTVSAINKIVEKRISSGGGSVEPTTTTPKMDGTAAVGSETAYARGDHVHPTDTTRLAVTVAESTYEKKHPVGSVVMTNTNTNPSETYGGTWELVRRLWGGELIAVGQAWTTSAYGYALTSNQVYAFSSQEVGTKNYSGWNFIGELFVGEGGTLKCKPQGIAGTIVVDMFLSGECQSGSNNESGIWFRNENQNALPTGVTMQGGNQPLFKVGVAGNYGAAHNQYIYQLAQGVTDEFYINPRFLCYRNPTWLSRGGTGCKLIAKAYARNPVGATNQYLWKRTA